MAVFPLLCGVPDGPNLLCSSSRIRFVALYARQKATSKAMAQAYIAYRSPAALDLLVAEVP